MKNNIFSSYTNDEKIIKKCEPKNKNERTLLKILLKEFGEFATIPEISETLKISRTSLYTAKDEGRFVTYIISGRIVILTRTLVPFVKTHKL